VPSSKQRREAERRRLQRQVARRTEREARRRKTTLVVSIVGTLAVIGIVVGFLIATSSDDKKPKAAASKSPTAAASTTASPTPTPTPSTSAIVRNLNGKCSFPAAGTAARKVTVPATTQSTKGAVTISVKTNRGDMTFTLDRAEAPCTVGSFVSLVKQKFFDNTPCPRVESTSLFILQCGDPTGTGGGGPGYSIPDEYTGKEKYTAGVLAMANTGQANSGGSQFFIVYKSDPLPASYTIFGKVTKGLDVVTKVAAGGNDGSNQAGGGKPKLAITLQKLTVKKK
jgi:peptidyl-prolyl cis-trans isomerase B (cyclophilin B)